MATPFFSSATRYPLTLKPITLPDDKLTHQDIFNISNTIRSLLRDMDTLFLGQTLSTPPPRDEDWEDAGTGGVSFQDLSEQKLIAPGGTSDLIIRYRPQPSTDPIKFTAAIHSQFPEEDYLGAGILMRNSISGALLTIGITNNRLEVSTYTGVSVPPTILAGTIMRPAFPQWYRITNDNTDISLQFCADGEHWITLHTLPSSTYDQVGMWVSNGNPTFPTISRLFSWRVEPL